MNGFNRRGLRTPPTHYGSVPIRDGHKLDPTQIFTPTKLNLTGEEIFAIGVMLKASMKVWRDLPPDLDQESAIQFEAHLKAAESIYKKLFPNKKRRGK